MEDINGSLFTFILVGAIAQLIDGSLGMGYKTSTTTFLLSLGIPPIFASSSVHIAGVVASASSGFSHWRFGNLDKSLFWSLVIPGIIGGIIGAALLSSIESDLIKPAIAIYLLLLGLRILLRALKQTPDVHINSHTSMLGVAGGFFDAIGGGGWGPIVTSTLLINGNNPRMVIGTVNIAEFFVTLFQSIAFLTLLDSLSWKIILGLMIGGATAAPFAAYITRFLPTQRLMVLVGLLVILLSLRTLFLALS